MARFDICIPVGSLRTLMGCAVSFSVDFEFKNAILQGIIVVFNEAMQRIVRAFEKRAAELYG